MKCLVITTAIVIAFTAPAFAGGDSGRAAGFGGSGNSEFDNLNGTMTGNVIRGLPNNTSSPCVCSRGIDVNGDGRTSMSEYNQFMKTMDSRTDITRATKDPKRAPNQSRHEHNRDKQTGISRRNK